MAVLDDTRHPSPEDLTAFGLGHLATLAEGETIARHIAECPRCEQFTSQVSPDRLFELVRAAASEADAALEPAPRRIVRGYEVLQELGHGGMGVVFLARQPGLGRLVALKRLQAGTLAGRTELARFQREAEALARIDHPNIVKVFDSGEQDGAPYLALEYVPGPTLAGRLGKGPLPPRDAAEIIETLARAIDFAHRAGIVHRDLKPLNVLLQSDPAFPDRLGIPKITDFGLARPLETARHTLSGTLLGTPGYMAPEQIAGPASAVGPAADIYALGAIQYECLTGRPPFRGRTPLDTLDLAREGAIVPPRKLAPEVPPVLEGICLRCLRKTPAERYASAGALADDLRRFLDGAPLASLPALHAASERAGKRRRILAVCLVIGLALLIAAGLRFAPTGTAAGGSVPATRHLVQHLDASTGVTLDDSGGVARWRDQGRVARDAVQGSPAQRPRLVADAAGGRPALRFDGIDDSLDLSGPPIDSPEFTILAVVSDRRAPDDAAPREILSNWSQGRFTRSVFLGTHGAGGTRVRFTDELGGLLDLDRVSQSGAALSEPQRHFILTAVSSAHDAVVYQNRRRLAALGRPPSDRELGGVWRLGTQGGDYEHWQGDLLELLVYDRALEPSDLENAWTYLAGRYAIAEGGTE